jgi:hypothetical protein
LSLAILAFSGGGQAAIRLESILSGLAGPLYVTNARDGSNRLFIVEQGGIVKVLQPGATSPTVFLDITSRVLSGGERGLLGLAFHPDFEANGRFFLNYNRQTDGATVVAEYRVSPSNPNVAGLDETRLLEIPQPLANHNGGTIEFGHDGFLYVLRGDGGAPSGRPQDVEDLLGKVLRIDVDHPNGSVPYSSPPDNPYFGAVAGRDEIFAIGFRNPFRGSFDRLTGALYVGDVGQGQREEADIVTRGGNYGWSIFEGTLCTGFGFGPGTCDSGGFTFPIAEYDHSLGRCSITGGHVYRGARGTLPWGAYVFGDFCTGEIMMLDGASQSVLLDTALNIASFGEDENGELYVVNIGGAVYRIVHADPSPPCAPSLSSTNVALDARGGGANVGVIAGTGCRWAAFSNVAWIAVTSGNPGTGNGSIAFSVSPNLGGETRTGTLSIAGQIVTVTQTNTAVPGAPVIGTATAGNASVSVTFVPGDAGSSAIDNYRVTCSGGVTGFGTASPITVTGLANGTTYTCTVAAHNSVGWSAESAPAGAVVPIAPPISRTFVASYGIDANGAAHSCDFAHPCRTFQMAFSRVLDGGEVLAVDGSGYGLVTIDRSVSLIANPGVFAGIGVFSGGTGITIATAGVNVTLRGLTLNGQGGAYGVNMTNGAKLSIENCVIAGFTSAGVNVGVAATVRIVDSLVRDNFRGVQLDGGATASISGSKFLGNSGNGILVGGGTAGTTTTAAISRSVVMGAGADWGIAAQSTNATANARAQVFRSSVTNAGAGVVAISTAGGGASVVLSRSKVTGNTTGLQQSGAGATLLSLANNTIAGNGADTSGAISPIAPQ